MACVRGTALVIIKKIITDKKQQAKQDLINSLTPGELKTFLNATNSNWISINIANSIYNKTLTAFKWKQVRGLGFIGSKVAFENLNSIYKFLINLLTVPFLLKKAPLFWSLYQNEGTASTNQINEHTVIFSVKNHQQAPLNIRLIISGFLKQLCLMTGKNHVYITTDFNDPEEWKWIINWA